MGWWIGWIGAVGTLLLAPVSGWFALRFMERQGRLWNETRAFLLLRRRQQAGELQRQRQSIYRQVEALVDIYRDGGQHERGATGDP